MKKIVWLLGCVLVFAGTSKAAEAQVDSELASNWDTHIGFFVPERSHARMAGGDIWFTFGAEHTVYNLYRYRVTFGIDYYGSGGLYNVPFTFNVRSETNRVRYGGGVGVGLSHDFEGGHSGVTYNLLVGYTVQKGVTPITADIRYMGMITGKGQLNGLAFTVGFHF